MVQHGVSHMFRLATAAFLAVMVAGVLQFNPGAARADELPPLQVVASFSVLGDMVKEVGGSHVNVVTIVGPNADAHTFEPTPQAVQALAKAQVLVSNGLDFETWLPRLIESSGFKGEHIVVSKGATLRKIDGDHDTAHDDHDHDHDTAHHDHDHGTSHDGHHHEHGDVDPHAWQNLKNGMVYARNIANGLAFADPLRATKYHRRAKKYLATMEKLDVEVRAALNAIPAEYRKAVTAHDAFGYFGDAYGVEFIPLAALSDAAEPSAKDVAAVIDRVRQEKRIGIFPEKISNTKLIDQLARDADAIVGGALYSDALDNPDEPAGTYLGMFHWNAGQLITVLKTGESDRPEQ